MVEGIFNRGFARMNADTSVKMNARKSYVSWPHRTIVIRYWNSRPNRSL